MKQEEAFQLLKLGANVFLTGPAGSGKTFLLNKYISYLKSKHISAAVTASTGIAATHIGGITIHSWCGMGIAKQLSKAEFKTILNKRYLKNRMLKTKVLIIDEISMLDADRLDLVNNICMSFKNSIAPFGGIQVIFCGDFFQLPPVNGKEENNEYAFKANVWNESCLKVCYLNEQHRHSDKKFIKVLNSIRNNKIDKDTLMTLKSRLNRPVCGNITPTKLFTNNKDVNAINDFELAKIKQSETVYQMKSSYKKGRKQLVDFLIKNCMAPSRLVLKKGAVVMFVKNKFSESGFAHYVNGTLGKIIGFSEFDNYPIVKTNDDRQIIAYPREWAVEEGNETVAKISQVPLRLAWAITVHKSQGMSLDEMIVDLRDAFDYGMGYVALSRVRSLSGMELLGLNKMSLQVNPDIVKRDKEYIKQSEEDLKNLRKIRDCRRMPVLAFGDSPF
ncbi:MAG: PIF1 family DEAD/DEAH box helicase [Patescibacteria group bacterium]|nr:PIF1 family DEAD/DEAH box helicase [Patescibacteria group bacterium]